MLYPLVKTKHVADIVHELQRRIAERLLCVVLHWKLQMGTLPSDLVC